MKTVKDLKIGDTLFIVDNWEYTILENRVSSLVGSNHAVKTTDSHFTSKTAVYSQIKDDTFFIGEYSNKVFCNKSEAIMEAKKMLCDAVDSKIKEINKSYGELAVLNAKIAEYL